MHHYINQKQNIINFLIQSSVILWLLSIPLKNAIYQASTILLITLFILHIKLYSDKKILLSLFDRYKHIFFAFFAFISIMLISNLFGIDASKSYHIVFSFFYRYVLILFILLYFTYYKVISPTTLTPIIIIILSIYALDGLYQFFYGVDFLRNRPISASYHIQGALFNPNPFGLLMALGSIIITLLLIKETYTDSLSKKSLLLLLLILFLSALLLSQSRASWIMYFFFTFSYLPIHILKYGINRNIIFMLITIFISIVVLFFMDHHLQERLSQLLEGYSSQRTTSIWPFTIDKIVHSPIIGYGINSFSILSHKQWASVHNLELEILLYTGLIGLLSFFYILFLISKEALQQKYFDYFLLLLSYLILLQFDGSLIDGKITLNIFILITFFIFASNSKKYQSS